MKKLADRRFRIVPGKHYGTPKELWGFKSGRNTGTPVAIARAFLRVHAEVLGIAAELDTLELARQLSSLGAHHVIFQQRLRRRRVHRAYVTVHLQRDGQVYLVKNRAVPEEILSAAKEKTLGEARAVALARRAVPRTKGSLRVIGRPELLWYPARKLLHPAWRVRVYRSKPRSEWIVYVHAKDGHVIEKYDNLSEATGKARVFVPNPMAGSAAFRPIVDGKLKRPAAESYREVRLTGLKGNGLLDGTKASTALTKKRIRKRDLDFTMNNKQAGFEEASAYYHVCAGIARLEQLGYKGKHAIFDAPLRISARGTRDDNSWYSPGEKTLTFGLGDVDDAEDGETVLHELGHAIQDAICPDFGQSNEAAAMGEGFGDYFAGSFFHAHKPAPYQLTVMSWDGARYRDPEVERLARRDEGAAAALEQQRPPCVRRLDSLRTYESFDHEGDEHDNGEIWSATLWEIRQAVGRDIADTIIVESHFQLDGFTSFARGARSILDADRNLYQGKHLAALRRIFRRRGIGPVE